MFSDITSETKSDNLMRVSCVAPMMAEVGIIKVAISVSGGTSYKINTEYVVGECEVIVTFHGLI